MRVVFDTSVLIAAFYPSLRGPTFSHDVYDYVLEVGTGFISADILEEFRRNLAKKLKFGRTEIAHLEGLLLRRLVLVSPPSAPSIKLRDPNDVHVVALALAVQADMVLTWDKDLLEIEEISKTRFLTPRQFWNTLE